VSRRLLAAVVLAAAGGGTVLAQVSVSIPEFGAVRAGATAKIEWRGLPEEADELELLLSVEGRDLPVRLTPQLAPRAGTLLWRVPNLPSRRARLTIRFGIDGKEVESAPSDAFEVLPSRDEPLAAIVFHDGEWWAQEKSESPLAGLLGEGSAGGRIQEERNEPPCAGSSFTSLPSGPRESSLGEMAPASRRPPRIPRPFPPRSPLDVPARI
jgi:hypothetical protein